MPALRPPLKLKRLQILTAKERKERKESFTKPELDFLDHASSPLTRMLSCSIREIRVIRDPIFFAFSALFLTCEALREAWFAANEMMNYEND